MGGKGKRNEVHYLNIFPPLSPADLQELVDAQIEALEKKAEAGEGEDAEESKSGVEIAADIMDGMKIRLAMVSANRMKAYDRTDAQTEARQWLLKELELTISDAVEYDFQEGTPENVQRMMLAMQEAADIIGALIPDKCEGGTPPKVLEEGP